MDYVTSMMAERESFSDLRTAHHVRIHDKLGCGQTGLAGQQRAERNKWLATEQVSQSNAGCGWRKQLKHVWVGHTTDTGYSSKQRGTQDSIATVNCETQVKF
jgi:hypothetical protein